MKSKTLWMLGLLLAGCYEDQPDPLPYPPLDERALVGCWRFLHTSFPCGTECFDRSSGYIHTTTFTQRNTEIRQDSGEYSISQNRLNIPRIARTSLGTSIFSDDDLSYTILKDTLQSTDPLGAVKLTRVHPDSFPCGLKPWTLFQKPPGWDSLIIPYDR